MNILHVVNIYFVLPYFIGDQFLYFKDKGHNMHVACSKSEYLADYAYSKGFKYLETPVNRSISISDDFKSIRNILEYIKGNNIDVVVGHTPKGGLLAMIAGWLGRVPKRIYFRHGIVYETSTGIKRFILKTVDRIASLLATEIVCVSDSVLQKSIEDRLAPSSKQLILGKGTCNGVDTINQFNPEKVDLVKIEGLRNRYGINENDFVIGYSGRLVRDKGIIELVSAFGQIEDQNCKLLLVGMFEERDALPEDVKEKILNDNRIVYTGFINGGMENYYSLMDMYALISYREGFPTGTLEAQAMELPVLTTRATGCRDSIVEGLTGLFTTHNPDEIAASIEILRKGDAIDGKEGRKWVVENFDSHKIWQEIEKLIV